MGERAVSWPAGTDEALDKQKVKAEFTATHFRVLQTAGAPAL